MLELKNITFVQYIELGDREIYDYAIKYGYMYNTPEDHFGLGDFMRIPFGIIKDIQYDLQQGMGWELFFDYVQKITGKDITKEKLLSVCQQRTYFNNSIEEITKTESIALAQDPDESQEAAGIDELSQLGYYLQIADLTGGDVTKNEQVRSLPYEDCFIELVRRKRLFDYQKALNRKHKNNF